MKPTYCDECDNLHPATAKLNEERWLCLRFPKLAGSRGFMSRTHVNEPYMRCYGINGGACIAFTPIRKAEGK